MGDHNEPHDYARTVTWRFPVDTAPMIRVATPADALAIATVHVRAWQSGYAGLIPEAFLGALMIDVRAERWRRNLEEAAAVTTVAESSGRVLGFASTGPARDADCGNSVGELWALYVNPECWRRGVGRLLWHDAQRRLACRGSREVTLWVLEGNARARAFYTAAGFVVETGKQKVVSFAGTLLTEIRLRKLLDAVEGR